MMSYVTAENCQLILAAYGAAMGVVGQQHGKAIYWLGVMVLTIGLKMMKG